MSIFDIFKPITAPVEWAFNTTKNTVKGAVDYATGAQSKKDRAEQQKLMNEQIAAYKEQTELSRQELNTAKEAQEVEKRRIQEKQIRAVRRNSSSRGFLGTSGEESGLNSQLGG